jgi:hypothetical protein
VSFRNPASARRRDTGVLGDVLVLISISTSNSIQSISEATISMLQKQTRGRELTDALLTTFTALLKSVPKTTEPLEVIRVPSKEPMFRANQLKEALDAAGFVGPPAYGTELVSGVGPGIYIRQNTKDGPIGTGIAAALRSVASTRELMHSVTVI